MMLSRAEDSVCAKLKELRLVCEREVPIQRQRIDSAISSVSKSLEATKSKVSEIFQNQAKIGKLKAELREVEDSLVKALSATTRKEAKIIAITDSKSAARARVEELKRVVEDQNARKNEYAEIISQQSKALSACEDKCKQNNVDIQEIEEPISWYNRILGFRIECGHGVKFIFTNINSKDPEEEYYFSVRHENDLYTLLECEPHLNDTKDLIHELNRSNGLFKFVRIMREKFKEAATHGNFPQLASNDQYSSVVSASAPVSSVSTEIRNESTPMQNKRLIEETNRPSKKTLHSKGGMSGLLSPAGSAVSVRRSPRIKVKK